MKQQITKNAIETAFLKLLQERNFEKVMVKDIVEECGLTRNTFYYYYDDTYNIIADILEREIREIMQAISEGQEPIAALADCFEYLEENPKLARHLFASAKKEDIYRYVCSAVEIVLNYSLDAMAGEKPVKPEDKRILVNTCKYVVQGMLEDWISQGMKYSLKQEVYALERLFGTVMRQIIQDSGN